MSLDTKSTTILSLLEKAANSSSEGITISTLSEKDRPLIYANEGFERLTGYQLDEVIGKNCRFLQGKDTEEEAVDEIRKALRIGGECTVELLNYRKDGTPFWNRLSITPLKDENGVITHYVGIQSDITELKETKKRLELANDVLEKFKTRMTREMDQASKTQQFILPTDLPDNDHLKFCAKYQPMDQIGGDYYDVIKLAEDQYGLMISDVTGHGIPAALLTFMTSFAFKNSVFQSDSTEEVISMTNEKLLNKMPKGAFVTMFYAIYDSNSKLMTYTQAGHPQGFVIRKSSKELIPLATGGGLVGVFDNKKISFGQGQIKLMEGDKIMLYTDAIEEAKNKENEMIENTDLLAMLKANSHLPIDTLFDEVHEFGLNFSGKQTYDDDFTLVGFEVLT